MTLHKLSDSNNHPSLGEVVKLMIMIFVFVTLCVTAYYIGHDYHSNFIDMLK